MRNKIYLWDLYDYETQTEGVKKIISKNPCFDLEEISSKKMQQELYEFIIHRSTVVGCAKLYVECNQFKKLCRFLKKYCKKNSSLTDKTSENWMRLLKRWMMKEGIPLTVKGKQVYGTEYRFRSRLITFFDMLLDFTLIDNREETEKDVWELEKLDIKHRVDLIRNHKTINFTKIYQSEIKEEVKKGIYLNLHTEAMDCIHKELTAIRRFSTYLKDKYPHIKSTGEITRELYENYLMYLKTEHGTNRRLHSELNRLRKLLETIGQTCDYQNLCELFFARDIPPTPKAAFKAYSDEELKRLNAAIVKMNEQDARLLVIHQMLGTRISDTLLLETDCLSRKQGVNVIRINQMKTKTYEKPISNELVLLIQKAIKYTKEQYGDTKYIFVNEKDITRPMQYSTLQVRVIKMIRQKDLRDDNGELFGFNTHMFRHCYGAKLTEMHLDDWTIAKLLGHSSVRNVRYYRKMSNKLLADETRASLKKISDYMLEKLNVWEAEYEQIRQNDCFE